VVLGQNREPLLRRVERGPFGDGKALQGASDLEPEVVVGVGGVVKVDDETPLPGRPRAVLAFRRERLVRPERIAFFAVFFERVVARTS
jgi:hypothetical protein